MIREDDNVLIGVSGGKDSQLLALALAIMKKRSPVKFNLTACMVDQTDGIMDIKPISDFMKVLNIPFVVETHPTFEIIKNREERSPCGLCANMRRGILATMANKLKCNVVALGHHKDDVAETVLLNLLYGGRFKCYHPHLYMTRTEIRVIRPMIYVEERNIALEAERLGLPIVSSCCPYGDKSKRKTTKNIVKMLEMEVPEIKSNIIHALKNGVSDDIWLDTVLNGEFEKNRSNEM